MNNSTHKKNSYMPYGKPYIDKDDIKAVIEVLESDWLTTGPLVSRFENAFSKVVNAKYVIACSSGTAGLHLSVMALGLKENDIVIVPANTFAATANVVRYVNADIIFSDVDPETGLMTPENFQDVINKSSIINTVIPVHYSGQCVDMKNINEIAGKNNISIIEDACHAIGAKHEIKLDSSSPVGSCSLSDITVFSLHPTKNITMGEGGIITTNNIYLRDKLINLRNHGINKLPENFLNSNLAYDSNKKLNPWYYEIKELGLNYRASDINCALGYAQLKKLNKFLNRRQELVRYYDANIKPLSPIVVSTKRNNNCFSACHIYVVLIDFCKLSIDRSELMRELDKMGIGTQVHYIPVYKHPYYKDRYGEINLPGAEKFYERCLTLPLFPSMDEEDVVNVVNKLTKIISTSSK